MAPLSSPSRRNGSHSRHRESGRGTPVGQPYIGQAEELILPDGVVGEETAELLQEFVHPQHRACATDDTLVVEMSEEEEQAKMKNLPWWKRPSPWWLLCALPFAAVAMSATIAPRIEIYTILACREMRPDIYYEGMQINSPPLTTLTPTRSQLCAADPVVQAAVAKLAAAMTTSMGILSCLTTGWWGAFSDRYGRGRVMGISVIGLLLTDFNFIFVSLFTERVPGGYWFLLLGPVVEGSLGGFTSGVAAIHAYQADVTNDHNRSRIFSLGLGLMFTGMAVGPTLGAFMIRSTGQLLSVYYVAAGIHTLYAFLVWFVLPQSLSLSYRLRAREKYAEELRAGVSERGDRLGVRLLVLFKRLFSFLTPLAVFGPEAKEINNNPLKKRRDWNLTLMSLAYAFTITIMGSYTYKFQYAALTFGWTSETLGYWLSLVGAARAFYLTAILPLAIKIFKPKPIIIEIAQTPSERSPLLSSSDATRDIPKKKKEIHSPAFDLGLARASLFIEIVAYTFMGLAPTPLAFTAFGMLGSMGSAFSPATQAVTLALYTRRGCTETGRLFGALSVLQALCSQILGPPFYAFIYVKTVATYPRAIFFVSVGTVMISSLLLSCVRLPKESYPPHAMVIPDEDLSSPSNSAGARIREETLVEADDRA